MSWRSRVFCWDTTPMSCLASGRVGHHVDRRRRRPGRGRDDPGGEHAGGRRLAGAVGPEQSEDLAGGDRQVELVDGPEVRAGVDLGQLDGLDGVARPRVEWRAHVVCRAGFRGWKTRHRQSATALSDL